MKKTASALLLGAIIIWCSKFLIERIEFDLNCFNPHSCFYLASEGKLVGIGATRNFDSYIALWDLKSGRILERIESKKTIGSPCVNKNNNLIAFIESDKIINVYSIIGLVPHSKYQISDKKNRFKKIAFSGDGNFIFCQTYTDPFFIVLRVNKNSLDLIRQEEFKIKFGNGIFDEFEVTKDQSKIILKNTDKKTAVAYETNPNFELPKKLILDYKYFKFLYSFSRDGDIVAYIKEININSDNTNADVVICIKNLKDKKETNLNINNEDMPIIKIDIIKKHGLICISSHDERTRTGKLSIYNIIGGDLKMSFLLDCKNCLSRSICISSDENRLLFFTGGGIFKIVKLDET